MKPVFNTLSIRQKLAQLSFVGILLTFNFSAQAFEVKGVKVDEVAQVGGSALQLNGVGLRTKMMFKVYVGALYLPQKQVDANAIINDHGNKRISMHFLREVASDQLIHGMDEGFFANNNAAELAVIEPQMKAFHQMMTSTKEVKEGDVILLDFMPTSAEFSLNGKAVGKVEGEAFNQALLRVWLGNHAVDVSLKKALLGQ